MCRYCCYWQVILVVWYGSLRSLRLCLNGCRACCRNISFHSYLITQIIYRRGWKRHLTADRGCLLLLTYVCILFEFIIFLAAFLWVAFSAFTLLVRHQEEYLAAKISDEVLALISVWSKVQMICTRSSWCHCHLIIFVIIKIQIGLTCRLIQVVAGKRLLNECLFVSSGVNSWLGQKRTFWDNYNRPLRPDS